MVKDCFNNKTLLKKYTLPFPEKKLTGKLLFSRVILLLITGDEPEKPEKC